MQFIIINKNPFIQQSYFNYHFIMEAQIGFKIMPYQAQNNSYDLFAKYSQAASDWSAIYIQKTPQHALTYIYTKYERFKEVCLMKFRFNQKIKFIQLDNEIFSKSNLSSENKAQISKAMLFSNYGIQIEQNQPLMDTLGTLNIGLIMEDSEKQYEYIVPHNLMQGGECYESTIPIRFQRHETKVFRTVKLIINDESKDVDSIYQDRIHEIPINFHNL
ncbi:unnamed protein product [Paramecium octaurelia]|uniref:Uncharacterized protein n=1 Tax=Paramecium octaurelia TaxID=43137 RepID=A0A8S1VFA9_PAROT|nr:unnamed protein product [Paramecium octaurelia]